MLPKSQGRYWPILSKFEKDLIVFQIDQSDSTIFTTNGNHINYRRLFQNGNQTIESGGEFVDQLRRFHIPHFHRPLKKGNLLSSPFQPNTFQLTNLFRSEENLVHIGTRMTNCANTKFVTAQMNLGILFSGLDVYYCHATGRIDNDQMITER